MGGEGEVREGAVGEAKKSFAVAPAEKRYLRQYLLLPPYLTQ